MYRKILPLLLQYNTQNYTCRQKIKDEKRRKSIIHIRRIKREEHYRKQIIDEEERNLIPLNFVT